jgi:hypothetical protein
MIIVSISFSQKWLKTIIVFVKKLCDYLDNHYFAKKQILAIVTIIAKRSSI